MGRRSLLLFRMHYPSRLLLDVTVDKETYAQKHERDAEPLSHVQDHILLESHLRLLDELDEETHSEASDEECSDKESSVELVKPVPVHQYLEDTQQEVAEGLIKLCRMLWLRLTTKLEDESPWKICDISVDFRIEEIAETDECSGEAYGNRKMVKNPYEIEIISTSVMSCKPPHCNEQRDSAAMTGESAFPWHEYLPEPLPAAEIIVRLIEEAMAQTGTDDSTDQKSIKKRIKKSLGNSFPLEEPLEDEPSKDETRDEKQRIPPERNRSDAEYLRIYMPVYHQCLKHNLSFLKSCKDNI